MKKPLEPLIPLDQLEQVVQGLIAVPKAAIDKDEERIERPKRKRAKPKQSKKSG